MKVNIFEAKARLSELVEAAEAGQRITICRRNRPVAELVRVGTARKTPRPVGGARGQLDVPPSFFEPLPDTFVDTFYPQAGPSRQIGAAAEGPPARGTAASPPARRRRPASR